MAQWVNVCFSEFIPFTSKSGTAEIVATLLGVVYVYAALKATKLRLLMELEVLMRKLKD